MNLSGSSHLTYSHHLISRYSDVPDIPASMIEEIDTLAKNYVSGLKSMEKFSQSDDDGMLPVSKS